MNSAANTAGHDFYLTRPFHKNINVFKEPKHVIAIAADIGHRIFKVGSDILRILQGKEREPLADLGSSAIVRTKEATIGAIKNVVGGIGNIFTGKFITGSAKIVQGGLDAVDIVPSIIADGASIATGVTKTRNAASTILNSTQVASTPIATVKRPTAQYTGQTYTAPTLSI